MSAALMALAGHHCGRLPARLVSRLSATPHVALSSVRTASAFRKLLLQLPHRGRERPPLSQQTRVYQTSSIFRAPIDRNSPLVSSHSYSLGAATPSPALSSPSSHFHFHFHFHQRPRTNTTPFSTTTSRTIMATASRSHAGHGHHHKHDNVYLTSKNKNDAGVRITRIGLFSNLGMALVKGGGGYMFNSQAMIADAWHSLTDLASDVLTLATVSWSLKPPTEKFPMGFGKIESLGSLGVSGMLLFGGLFMCMNSCETLFTYFFHGADAAAHILGHGHSHGHSHSHAHMGPSIHAAWLAAGTVLVKEWLYHATMKVARERKSSVLASNAVHHRVDSLTGIVTLGAILGANFLSSASWLDPVGGLLISLLVIRAGWGNTWSALLELADGSIDEEIKGSVRRQVMKVLSGPEAISEGHEVEVREISGIKSGQNYLIDLELAVPNAWTVEDVRDVEDAVRTRVGGKVRGVRRVRVRFVPKEEAKDLDKFDEFIPGDVSPKTSPEPEDEHDHDHDHGDDGHSHGNVKDDKKKR